MSRLKGRLESSVDRHHGMPVPGNQIPDQQSIRDTDAHRRLIRQPILEAVFICPIRISFVESSSDALHIDKCVAYKLPLCTNVRYQPNLM